MEFEFDPDKSNANKGKHGIDFEAAQALWDDPDFVETPARTTDERRFLIIGRIGNGHLVCGRYLSAGESSGSLGASFAAGRGGYL